MATPNVAHITLGVEVTADTVKDATTNANTTQAAIIARMKSLNIADKDIQTSNYSIFPVRDDQRPPAPGATPAPTRTQYRVSESIRVTLRDLNGVGPAIDAAVDAGANSISGIQFTVEDPTPLMDQARAAAVADARRRAQQLAQAAGVTLGPPSIITENIGSVPVPVARAVPAPAAMAAADSAPIEAGELTFTSQIQITFVIP
jgi:uncharacterized protein YggE